MEQAFAHAVASCGDASVCTFFAAPANVSAALHGEALLAQHGSVLLLWDEERTMLAEDLQRADALWFSTDVNAQTASRIPIYALEVITWLTKRKEGSETVISDLLPFTIGYLFHDLLEYCARELQSDCLEMLLESPTFRRFFSNQERLWALGTAATSIGPECSRDIVDLLVAHGTILNVEDPSDVLPTPQLGACAQYGTTALTCLVENGARSVGIQRALATVAKSHADSTCDLVRILIRLGVDVNTPAKGGIALHEAARAKNSFAVRALVVDGFADLDARDDKGRTALLRAVEENDSTNRTTTWTPQNVAAIEQLLALGASVDAQDQDGRTALLAAPLSRQYQVFHVLLAHGANPNIADTLARTPLHRVGAYDRHVVELTRLLLDKGADVNARTRDGDTPLLSLVRMSLWRETETQREAIALLLQCGADPNIPDHNGETPLQCYLERRRANTEHLVQLLEDFGA